MEESETEEPSDAEEGRAGDNDLHVLRMLYRGNMEEVSRREEQCRHARVFNRKHTFYRHTRCTDTHRKSRARCQEASSTLTRIPMIQTSILGSRKRLPRRSRSSAPRRTGSIRMAGMRPQKALRGRPEAARKSTSAWIGGKCKINSRAAQTVMWMSSQPL